MRALGLLLFVLCLGFSGAPAAAQGLPEGIKARLIQVPVLRGDFEQSKQVQGFSKPLVSRGQFLVARERGVLWHTRSPFASQLKLTRDEIVATHNGAVAFRLDAGKEPSVRVINSLLFALLNGDLQGLGEHFRLEGRIDAHGQGWKLELIPRQAALAKLMSKIELSGDQYVRSVRIDEANGDRTSIRFTAQRSEPAVLSVDEVARFD